MALHPKLLQQEAFSREYPLSEDRRKQLEETSRQIKNHYKKRQALSLVFVCTHNSRRSHLAQLWAQAWAHHFDWKGLNAYSAGTESTEIYPTVIKVLDQQGFDVGLLSDEQNPYYSISYSADAAPVLSFSKRLTHPYNPKSGFIAIMVCSEADAACPYVPGAVSRITLPYDDPKESDGSSSEWETYLRRSRQIAAEWYTIFSMADFSPAIG